MSRLWIWAGCATIMVGLGIWLWSNGYSNVLTYGILLLCPLMHLFMHRGHGHGANTARATDKKGETGDKETSCH